MSDDPTEAATLPYDPDSSLSLTASLPHSGETHESQQQLNHTSSHEMGPPYEMFDEPGNTPEEVGPSTPERNRRNLLYFCVEPNNDMTKAERFLNQESLNEETIENFMNSYTKDSQDSMNSHRYSQPDPEVPRRSRSFIEGSPETQKRIHMGKKKHVLEIDRSWQSLDDAFASMRAPKKRLKTSFTKLSLGKIMPSKREIPSNPGIIPNMREMLKHGTRPPSFSSILSSSSEAISHGFPGGSQNLQDRQNSNIPSPLTYPLNSSNSNNASPPDQDLPGSTPSGSYDSDNISPDRREINALFWLNPGFRRNYPHAHPPHKRDFFVTGEEEQEEVCSVDASSVAGEEDIIQYGHTGFEFGREHTVKQPQPMPSSSSSSSSENDDHPNNDHDTDHSDDDDDFNNDNKSCLSQEVETVIYEDNEPEPQQDQEAKEQPDSIKQDAPLIQSQGGTQKHIKSKTPAIKKQSKSQNTQTALPPRRSRQRKRTIIDDKVFLSRLIEPEEVYRKYEKFIEKQGWSAQNLQDCTICVVPKANKHSVTSRRAQLMGKDIVAASWLEDCMKKGRKEGYDFRHKVDNLEKIQGIKDTGIYFSKTLGFKSEDLDQIKSGPFSGVKLIRHIKDVKQGNIGVIKDNKDPEKGELKNKGIKPILIDDFILDLSLPRSEDD